MGDGNAPTPQAVRPLAQALPNTLIPPLDWRQICSSKCPGPPRRRMRLAKIMRHKIYFQRTFLKHDCTTGSSNTLRRSLHGTGPAASSQGTDEGLGCCSATSETARLGPLGRHCKGSISVSVQQKLCTERGLQYGRLRVVAVGPVIHQHPRRRRRTQALRRYRCSLSPSLPPSLPP